MPRSADGASRIGLWALRLLLAISLALCSYLGYRHLDGRRSVDDCLGQRSCVGETLRTTRFLDVAERLPGGGWRLEAGGVSLRTASALPGVQVGDLLEAEVTFTARRQVSVGRYVALCSWRLTLRVALSVAASLIVLGLLARRALRRRGRCRS